MYCAPLKGHEDVSLFTEELLRYTIEQINYCDLCVCVSVSLACTALMW